MKATQLRCCHSVFVGGRSRGGALGFPLMEPATFQRLHPSRFLSFTIPNPRFPDESNPYGDPLRVAVLDSPDPPSDPQPVTAAMLVPKYREDDWIFSTHRGHLQLLLGSSVAQVSRLVLVGDNPSPVPSSFRIYTRLDSDHRATAIFEQSLYPLLLVLSPKPAFGIGLPSIPFLSYEDNIIRRIPVERAVGPVAGEMLVEDVVIDTNTSHESPPRQVRRRLRFERLPNLVQTQVLMVPDSSGAGQFRLDTGVLVQPYLAPMVAGLSLICPFLEEQIQFGSRPRVLCLGVGGGALLTFLHSRLGFDVLGVEADDVVLSVARRHFGLREDKFLRVFVGDGIKLIESFARERDGCILKDSRCPDDICASETGHVELGYSQGRSFDAIMVDLDSSDAASGASAPPSEFLANNVLSDARLSLHHHSILVVNVVPLSGSFYNQLIDALHAVFCELYEIHVASTENYVLIATTSPIQLPGSYDENFLFQKLKEVVGERYVNCMRKV